MLGSKATKPFVMHPQPLRAIEHPIPNPYDRPSVDVLEWFRHLVDTEHELQPGSDFFVEETVFAKTRRGVTEEKRRILMVWVLEVSQSFGLNHCTIGHCVILIDRTLEKVEVMRHLALIGLSCLWISSKFLEVQPLAVKNLQECVSSHYNTEDIIKMEKEVRVYVYVHL